MKVAIHQPHYFPWLGYLNKMASVDEFIILDEVQLSDNSNMCRNRFLTKTGKERYLTVSFEKKDYMKKRFCDVKLNTQVNWQRDHKNFLFDTYGKLVGFNEVWSEIKHIFEKRYETAYEVSMDSILVLRELFDIRTPLIYQSTIDYCKQTRKNDLVLSLCEALHAQIYLSGNGAKKYMQVDSFLKKGINVEFQEFSHPCYPQAFSSVFIPNLSSLDLLFNCGIEASRHIFWCSIENK